MNVIENTSYFNLDLFYKGEMTFDELMGESDESSAGAAVVYGAGNWLYYTGETERAETVLRNLLETPGWAAFGYIAAEADLAAR